MSYYLFVDDVRNPRCVDWVPMPENVQWFIAKSYEDFTRMIRQMGVPKFVAFDHDLHDEHYQELGKANQENRPFDNANFKVKTGYDCALWLVIHCAANKQPIPEFQIHTMNPVAAYNIRHLLQSAKRIL